MKFAAAAAPPPGGVIRKSVVLVFATMPVGAEPGILTVCGLGLSVSGVLPTSPRTSCVVLVALLTIQNGLALRTVIPHGFANKGSSTGAMPGMSEINVRRR